MNRIWWCPSCHRTYQEGQQRGKWPMRLCYYADCNSLAELGQIDWRAMLERDPSLPQIPSPNTRYSVQRACISHGWRVAL